MKWFLQFLSIGSAVIYTLLVIIDNRIPDGTAENIVASEAQSQQRRLTVWGPYLPNRSFGQDRRASLTTHRAHQQNEALASKPYRESPRQYFDHQPASKDKLATSAIDDDQMGKRPASLPITGGSFEPSVPLEGKEAIWLVVSRAARLHAGPSVSSRTTHFYPVGTELKLVGHVQGWFQVLDPATLRQGGFTRSTISRRSVVPARRDSQCKTCQTPHKWRSLLQSRSLQAGSRSLNSNKRSRALLVLAFKTRVSPA